MVYLHMFIMIRLIAGHFAANITGKRASAAMDFHMFRQIITPMERLTTLGDFTHIFFSHFVFAHVTLAVVFPYKLAAAVITSVRPY